MNDIELLDGIQVMDSRAIAELTGKQHAHVCRDIQAMFEGLGIDQSSFGSVYKAGNGEDRRCYKLPRRECLILVSGYSVELRAKIIDRWEALETGKAIPVGMHKTEHTPKLPNGVQMRELRILFERGAVTAEHVQLTLGLTPAETPRTRIKPELPAPQPKIARFPKTWTEAKDRVRQHCKVSAKGVIHWTQFGISQTDLAFHCNRANVRPKEDFIEDEGFAIVRSIYGGR